MGSTEQIWPGPECLKSKPWPLPGDRVVVLDRRGSVDLVAPVISSGDHFVEVPSPTSPGCRWLVVPQDVVPAHAYGIALGHVRARARMRRFVAWLSDYSACAERAALMTGMSPEAAVRSGSLYELQWLATRVLHGRWRRVFGPTVDVDAENEALLASPEWASLPWQRDPEGQVSP